MHRLVVWIVAVVLGIAYAAPFVWPAAWTASVPGEAKPGGIIKWGNLGEYNTVNPFIDAGNLNLWDVIRGDSLFTLDPITFEFVPYMAESYTVSKDQLVWTLKLRPGMKWSDGQPIVADDFVSAAEIARALDYSMADILTVNKKPVQVAKIDSSTLKVTFPARVVIAKEILSYLIPAPSHIFGPVFRTKGPAAVRPMYSLNDDPKSLVLAGPWLLKGHRPGERILLERNPYFGEWNKDSVGKPLPYLEGQEVLTFKDNNGFLASFLNGDIDLVGVASVDQVSQIRQAIDRGRIEAVLRANIGPSVGASWLVFNWNHSSDPEKQRLFRSSEFRRAISHLINRQAIVDLVYSGLAFSQYTSVPQAFAQWISPTLNKYDYDPKAAATLLAGLGYARKNTEGYLVNAQGRVLEFNLTAFPAFEQITTLIADSLRQAGIKMNVVMRDVATAINLRNSIGEDRPFDALALFGNSLFLEFPFGNNYYTCAGAQHVFNTSGQCLLPWETQVTALYERGIQETDLAKRKQIAYQIEDIWSAQQPFIYLPRGAVNLAWNARVAGEYPMAAVNGFNFDRNLVLTWIR